MEVNLVFPFLDPVSFFYQILAMFPLILYNLLIYKTIWRYKEEFKLTKLLLLSSLIALGVSLASFFLPTIEARNISEDEMFGLNLFFTLISLPSFLLIQFVPALSLLIFGYFNRKRHELYLLLTGTFLFTFYLISFFISTLMRFTTPTSYLENIILYTFFSYMNFIIILVAYAFLIVHGVLNKQPLFRNTGIIMSATFVFLFFFSSFFFQLILEFFRGNL